MKEGWERGLNFSQVNYKILDKNSFEAYLRSDLRCTIPREILETFDISKLKSPVALVAIRDTRSNEEVLRIKKIYKSSNSYTISLKAERRLHKPTIELIEIKSEESILSRSTFPDSPLSYLPSHTAGGTPIYSFAFGKKLVVGGYYKKDLLFENILKFNDDILSALGLYFAEGGKTAASFTNSWPDAINCVLSFIEKQMSIDREDVKATIYCNPSLKDKQKKLEEFWSSKTGISNFAPKLHFGKNSTSPQGTLELYFCSEVVKEFLVSLMDSLPGMTVPKGALLDGVLSGDGSPIQSTKYSIVHQLPVDRKNPKNERFIKWLFADFKAKKVTPSKFNIYAPWEQNKRLLFDGAYTFNTINQLRFAKRFLGLPKTQLNIEGDRQLKNFRSKDYPAMLRSLLDHYRQLVDLELCNHVRAERRLNEFSIR
ncbi:MAG: hypothetical protein JW834_01190 [Candidatus Diapherotrites archaeon]|nr:hypothetical protein [Candidatus Diapherotrites archaeon]